MDMTTDPPKFAVVRFTSSCEVEIIPRKWLSSQENVVTCAWPNKASLKTNPLHKCILECIDAEQWWDVYEVVVLSYYSTYILAAQGRRIAEDTDSIASGGEQGRGKRRRKRPCRYQTSESSEDGGIDGPPVISTELKRVLQRMQNPSYNLNGPAHSQLEESFLAGTNIYQSTPLDKYGSNVCVDSQPASNYVLSGNCPLIARPTGLISVRNLHEVEPCNTPQRQIIPETQDIDDDETQLTDLDLIKIAEINKKSNDHPIGTSSHLLAQRKASTPDLSGNSSTSRSCYVTEDSQSGDIDNMTIMMKKMLAGIKIVINNQNQTARDIANLKSSLHLKLANHPEPDVTVEDGVLPSLPLQSTVEMDALDFALQNPDTFNCLVEKLRKLGGNTIGEAARSMLNHTISASLSTKYTWGGTRSKAKFSDKKLVEVLFVAIPKVRACAGAENAAIKHELCEWLRHCSQRVKRKAQQQEPQI